MTTGPLHYRIAEQLAEKSGSVEGAARDQVLARAQIHATLALTAATVRDGLNLLDGEQWREVVS